MMIKAPFHVKRSIFGRVTIMCHQLIPTVGNMFSTLCYKWGYGKSRV